MTSVNISESDIANLDGKVAIVTGGASGIGKAMVELLHKLGASIAIFDLNDTRGPEVVKELGSKVQYIRCNVMDWEQLSNAFACVKERFGSIDLVFANAGVADDNSVFQDLVDDHGVLTPPNLAAVNINLKAVITTTKLALHYFKKNKVPGGGLVMTASTSSYNERPNIPIYSASKHGVLGFFRAVRHVAPPLNVTVGAIAPGGTESNMFTPMAAEMFAAKGIPVNKASSVALAAVFLATTPAYNGKALTIMGNKYTEVEGPILETQPQWYGEYNTDMVRRAASVRLDQVLSK